MRKTNRKPWDLPAHKIADAVQDWRLTQDMSKSEFGEECRIHHLTLRKVEAGIHVDKRIIARIATRFPGVFA